MQLMVRQFEEQLLRVFDSARVVPEQSTQLRLVH
jgi:hypothetical protein